MNSKFSERRMDFSTMPTLSDAEQAELAALAHMSEDAVDTSDLPELDATFWRTAQRGRFYRPIKKSTTIRIDADILHWLRTKGRGYQTRINAILREAMMKEAPTDPTRDK